MTTFEKCKNIRHTLLTRAAEGISYASWRDGVVVDNLKNIHKLIAKWEETSGSYKIDPTDLTEHEMNLLDFGKWSQSNPMRLIPMWLHPFLADFESESISGSKHHKASEIDNDHRGGFLAYGVIPKTK